MSGFAKAIGNLFSGRNARLAQIQQGNIAAQQRETQTLAQGKQIEAQQAEQAQQEVQLGRARRTPKGRRLLEAAGAPAVGAQQTLG